MPNWCANSLKLVAKTEQQRNDLKFIRENYTKEWFGLFNYFVPCPEELRNSKKGFPADPNEESNTEKYGYATWYEFNIENWGTKWDACEITIEDFDDDTLTLTFDTAWSPPEQFYFALHDNEWVFTASFVECGCDFIGYFKDGKCESENFNDGSLDFDSDTFYEDETARVESYFDSVGIDHYPAHTGG